MSQSRGGDVTEGPIEPFCFAVLFRGVRRSENNLTTDRVKVIGKRLNGLFFGVITSDKFRS